MQMTQIMQSLPVFVAHSPRKIRIAQPPVPRRLRHILQHTQLLLNHLLPLPRNLPPSRQNVVLHVAPLFRRHSPPGIFFRAKVRALLRVQSVPLIKLLPNPALLFWRQILERTAALQHTIALLRIQITHAVHKRTRRANTNLLPGSQRRSGSTFMRPIIEVIGSRRFRHRSRWTIRSIVGLTLRIRCVLRRAPCLALSLPRWRTIRVRLIYVRPRNGL